MAKPQPNEPKNADSAQISVTTRERGISPQRIAIDADSKGGSTHVSVEVVAKMASLAIREVPGVHALAPWGTAQTLSNLANSIRGSDPARDFGVHVEIGTLEAAIDCRIVTEYGAKIPEVAKEIRKRLKSRIEPGTGLTLKEINVDVVDLYFPPDAVAPPEEDDAPPSGRMLK